MEGELMSVERQGFQKRYDLAERCLPADAATAEPSLDEHADHVIELGLAAHGFGTEQTFAYFRRDAKVRAAVRRRLKEGSEAGYLELRRMQSGEPIYARPGAFDAPNRRLPDIVRILSPFDNALIQRARGAAVFGFDYTIECYTPEAKRTFGYFALPLVFRDRFVGRMDCKAHRDQGLFEIKALFFQTEETMGMPATELPEEFLPAFAAATAEYAAFCGCDEVAVGKVSPATMAAPIKALF